MKKQLLFLSVVLSLNTFNYAQWISLDKNSVPDAKPIVKLISDDITGTIINVQLPGIRIKEFKADGKFYNSISIGEAAITNNVGQPELPHIAKILAIPDQGSVSFEVLEMSEVQIINGINIPPVRESWFEGEPETKFIENVSAYSSENVYPADLVSVEDPVIFRDFRISRVSIYPVRYSPAKHELEVISSMTIKIKYGSGPGINPMLGINKPIAPSFNRLYKSIIFNYDEVLQREYNGDVLGYDLMLCFMPDSFVTSFQPYADWNHKTGTYIKVVKFSEIGATGSNPVPIKNYILSAFTSWLIPPTHVLIIGDLNVAPHQNISLDGWTFPYDDYFVELTGNDFFPELMIGRFTNQANAKLRNIRNKLINYEKIPYLTDPNWFRRGLVCSNDAYVSQIETKRFTKQKMLYSGNFISVDSMYNGYPCPGNITTITNMINTGRGWLNYRGEGWYTGWGASCFPFDVSDVNTLTNGQKLTFVTSIGCGVANWTSGSTNGFGEAWLEIGDENSPKGACSFIGPTSNTHTAYNNNIDKGIYVGMFDEGLDSPGEALLRGKFYMYEVFGQSDFYVGYHYRIYNILGDPSLHIWKATPLYINVNHTDTVAIGISQVIISVTEASSGLPVADAQICISGSDVYVVASTLANGTATISINPQQLGQLNITVYGGKLIPYEGTVHVVESANNTFQLNLSITNGWNMVSAPGINPTGMGVSTWWPHLTGTVWGFSGTIYVAKTIATPGEGYWMKNTLTETYNYPAIQIAAHDAIPGHINWNIIGVYEDTLPTSGLTTVPSGQITGTIWGFNGVQYVVASTLEPGYGYWVKLLSACDIIIPEALAKGSGGEVAEYFREDWGKIVMTDAAGISFTLYAVNGDSPNGGASVDLDQYEMPPAPPSGMFDVRFSSGRVAEDINSSMKTIDLNGITYPLTVRVEGMDIRLQDVTGKTINQNLKSGESVVINDATIQKLMVRGELMPTVYALEQNYPNPFNPSTVIEFSLPEDVSNVKLSIYNALGEKVAELVNTSLTAGRYSYQWNAKNVATGMYIYELRTDKFVSVKKMILMK